MKQLTMIIPGIFLFLGTVFSQTRTVGLFLNNAALSYPGYTLFAPKHNTMTYLINNNGEKIHEWTASTYSPGQAVYLIENGHLLRTCSLMVPGGLALGGGEGGRLEEYTWNDTLVWSFNYATSNYTQHHDVKRLPNGNIIMVVAEKKLLADVLAAGFDPAKLTPDINNQGYMAPDCIIEVQPVLPNSGIIVWEWHVWDHLIQDYSAAKNNYGIVNQHPELVDCDGDHRMLPLFWNHVNSIDYHPGLDQIAISVRGNSEVWVIDHSTTTAQSASHSGGVHGRGGDLLYRWGNPLTYGAGTQGNQKYDEQHDVEWVRPDCPGAGNFTCFNNGIAKGYSSVDEFVPPVTATGSYTYTPGSAYGPSDFTWSYSATPPDSLFAHDISGAQRLQNGNTLIDNGPKGVFTEVTPAGQVVWKYTNPTVDNRTLCKYDPIPHDPTHAEETLNSVFRVYRYPFDYSAFTGKTLTPQGPIECFPTGIPESMAESAPCTLDGCTPNPAREEVTIRFRMNVTSPVTLIVSNLLGHVMSVLADETMTPGDYQQIADVSGFPAGVYFVTLRAANISLTKKMMVTH